jgi:predicted acylesterase/phospholipase RssA
MDAQIGHQVKDMATCETWLMERRFLAGVLVVALGVAVSGGGHRAALWALGVLLYLADSGKNREVPSIASVSGGSLTNAYVAQRMDFSTRSDRQFEAAVRPLVTAVVTTGTMWAPWTTWAYLALLGIALLAALCIWLLPIGVGYRLPMFVAALIGWALLAQLRGRVCAHAFAKTLYSGRGVSPLLSRAHTEIDHVICATDLHAGEHVYLSPAFVCSYRFGWGEPGSLLLHTAVQCSAALPGAFPVRWLPTKEHAFHGGTHVV